MTDPVHMCCPFCGGERLLMTESRTQVSSRLECWIRCGSCGAEGPWHQSPGAAIGAWNRRVEPAKKTATVIPDFEQDR